MKRRPSAKKAQKMLNARGAFGGSSSNNWVGFNPNPGYLDTQISYPQISKVVGIAVEDTLVLEDVLKEYQSFENMVKEVADEHGSSIWQSWRRFAASIC